jgi:predicted O-methyltransferase YrrM
MKALAPLRSAIDDVLAAVPIDFGGGCSVSKGTVLAYLIQRERIQRSVDIGVYRGRSFFPQALVHTRVTKGRVYGIDPYTKADAMEHDHKVLKDEIAQFVETTDFDQLFAEVDGLRDSLGFTAGSEIMRMRSDQAAPVLAERGEQFGLIHIDGNHDTRVVMADVDLYLPLLDPDNGFLVFDDISWPAVKPAVDKVSRDLALIYARVDTYNDYAVFWTGRSARKKSRLRKEVALAGEG